HHKNQDRRYPPSLALPKELKEFSDDRYSVHGMLCKISVTRFQVKTFLVLCTRYGLIMAARSLGEFQGGSEALPRKHSGLVERAPRKFAQRTGAGRVELKMARRLLCVSVTGRKGHAPSSRLGSGPF